MNIYNFAIDMEKEGEAYYRELALKTPDVGLQKILNMLADDENKHTQIIKKMKAAGDLSMAETRVLKDAKNIFVQMKESGEGLKTDANQVDFYRKAQELERKSEDFYRQKREEVADSGEKMLFGKLAYEEKKHFLLLHHIIEMVSRPENWVENAEFFHLDEY
jgi:rubrerythrin